MDTKKIEQEKKSFICIILYIKNDVLRIDKRRRWCDYVAHVQSCDV